MLWARLLAYVTGTVNQELLLRNEYRAAENRILRGQIKGRVLLTEGEKATLAQIAHRLGRMALKNVAATAKPHTILGWYRKLIASKFDGSKLRRRVGRPKVDQETERLVLRMARENPSWGYDRIVGALGRAHRDVLVGMDFFTTEVLTRKGLTAYYVRFFIHLKTRRVNLAATPAASTEERRDQSRWSGPRCGGQVRAAGGRSVAEDGPWS